MKPADALWHDIDNRLLNLVIESMKHKLIHNFLIFMNEELKKGSFGKVYKGINDHNKQPVAIKVLAKNMSNNCG